MSKIVDALTPNALVLFNESVAATNEREGSESARQIMRALVEKRIKVFFVTHFYAFAHRFYDQQLENVMFLLAERRNDGGRTFKVVEGEPLQTSYGEDLYTRYSLVNQTAGGRARRACGDSAPLKKSVETANTPVSAYAAMQPGTS
jgi:DNA mismatch repair ATPase MutS